jgi:glycosyltransferase involved in cell wall biosynthesis
VFGNIPVSSSKKDLKVSVIICCYSMDRLQDVHEAVASVLSQTRRPGEIIVSVDHTLEVFQQLKKDLPSSVKVILNEGVRGLSETRNVGIRASSGDIIAFIDDDTVAEGNWLEMLSGQYDGPRVIAVGGRALPIWEGSKRPAWFPEELDWVVGCTYKGLLSRGNEVRNMPGCNMSFRREAFEKAGLFNVKVGRIGKVQGMGEDTEICIRIKHALPDNLILIEPNAIVYHKVPSWRVTWKYLISRSYNEGLYKIVVRNLAFERSSALSSEDSFLRYLLFNAIPDKFLRWHEKGSLLQAAAILLNIIVVGAGYLRGKLLPVRVKDQNNITEQQLIQSN